jgi:hypothetical protein
MTEIYIYSIFYKQTCVVLFVIIILFNFYILLENIYVIYFNITKYILYYNLSFNMLYFDTKKRLLLIIKIRKKSQKYKQNAFFSFYKSIKK